MYLRQKSSKGYTYVQLVEGYRDQGKVRQRVIATLGRLDQLQSSGQLDSFLHSAARYAQNAAVLSAHRSGEIQTLCTRKLGPGRLFGRLWRELRIEEILHALLARRCFHFDVERAVFLTTLHRLIDPGSDRAAEKWARDYEFGGAESLELHQLYRAMAWLGEELTSDEQDGATEFSPRCVKDLVEEKLFVERSRPKEMVLCFFDTTSLYFEGAGGEELGKRGHSKDSRPDLNQVVLALVLDPEGWPICTELWPGNTTDVKSLVPLLGRLEKRFGLSRVCMVADRGMFSAEAITELEKRPEVRYILGAKMRKCKEVRDSVLSDAGTFEVVHPARKKTHDPSPLSVKEVKVDTRRYIVCYNEEQARKDAHDREQILEKLRKRLREGPKALVGNNGFRKFLKTSGSRFEVDEARVRAEARYDGKWVLRTNTDLSAEQVALTYKKLWMVESTFASAKSVLRTRPIYHRSDAAIRGHIFCSFLSLLLIRELDKRMKRRGWSEAEWSDLIRDIDALSETQIQSAEGRRVAIRSALAGWCAKAFEAVGVALPPTVRMLETPTAAPS